MFAASQKKTLRTVGEDNFNELLSIITEIDTGSIEDRKNSIDDKTVEFLNSLTDDIEFDLKVYCDKTGQAFREFSREDYFTLKKVHGQKKAEYILDNLRISQICPMWLYTDGESLNKLSEIDPRGYFVYACSIMLLPLQPYIGRKLNQFEEDKEARVQWHKDKVELYRKTEGFNLFNLVRINELIRRYLQIFKTSSVMTTGQLNWHSTDLKELDFNKLEKNIKDNIISILKYEKSRNRIKPELDQGDITELSIIHQGHSSFRHQRKLERMTPTERIAWDLQGFMAEANEKEVFSKSWRIRTKSAERDSKKREISYKGKVFKPQKDESTGKVKIAFGKKKG